MRIAALYWPTSSVGGINTCLRALRDEADRRGDTFHVLRSGTQVRIAPTLFKERKVIRGGDTFITIDGEASHHPAQVGATLDFLHANYDMVYLAYLCPHPTKAYGDVPLFLPLLRSLMLPIAGRVTDGYWEDYRAWGEATVALCGWLTYTHRPMAGILSKLIKRSCYAPTPMEPRPSKALRSGRTLTVYTSQWKAIKGIHKILPIIPEIWGDVELYSNGILYYQMRNSDDWKRAVGKDHFAPEFSGKGKAPFFGNVTLEEIPNVLSRAWFMLDLMGHGKPKHETYKVGAINNTTREALYYGACPILHRQASNVIPANLALYVNDAFEIPKLILRNKDYAINPHRQKLARDWVKEYFSPKVIYDQAVLGKIK